MGRSDNYKIDIIERTTEIIRSEFKSFKKRDREVTFLMNCLLGTIVSITENENIKANKFKGKKIDAAFLKLIPNKFGFLSEYKNEENLTDQRVKKKYVAVKHRKDLVGKYDKFWFLNKIRNGIAHQNNESINEGKNWVGVKIWNNNKSMGIDFEIEFTINQLKTFIEEIAKVYLEA